MMDVFIDELGKKAESNFFDSFNWDNFEFGDIVFLEDCGEVQAHGAWVAAKTQNTVTLRILTDDDYKVIVDCGADNLHQVIGA